MESNVMDASRRKLGLNQLRRFFKTLSKRSATLWRSSLDPNPSKYSLACFRPSP